jgi:PTH1 family peptidyl-tRNA hydrolase
MTSWLVVGLGNPGPAFASHRHNLGYRVAEELARRLGVRFRGARGIRAEVAEGRLGPPAAESPRLIVAKSRTFMNETGWAVTRLLAYYKLQPAQMIVVHDELDIDPGQLRVKFGDFYRVRIGVGRPPGRQDPADFLLSDIPARAREDAELEIGRAADAVESLVVVGLDGTQNAFNT